MKPTVLCVHQIGKVGSTSIAAALQQHFPKRKVYQTHVLSEAGILHGLDHWLGQRRAPRGKFPDHLSRSIELRRRFPRGYSTAEWFMICLVREPLTRDISAFFQDLHVHWIYRLSEKARQTCRQILDAKSDDGVAESDLDEAVADLERIFSTEYHIGLFDAWFDREVRDVFGLDVFARPFSHERGYEILDHAAGRLLLMRAEDASRAFDPAARAWLAGSELEREADGPLTLGDQRANEGGAKAYAGLYRRFLEKVKASPAMAVRSKDSKVVRHFYPERLAA